MPNPTNPTPDTATTRQAGNEMVARWMGWKYKHFIGADAPHLLDGWVNPDNYYQEPPDLYDPCPAGAVWREACEEALFKRFVYGSTHSTREGWNGFNFYCERWEKTRDNWVGRGATLAEARANAIIAAVRAIEAAKGQEGG